MGQVLNTRTFGSLEFEKTWIAANIHIGKLTKGGYVHITGHSIKSKSELESVIPRGKDLDEALFWFDHKDDIESLEGKRNIVIQPDGAFTFDNGEAIQDTNDLISNLPPGSLLDAALMWWAEQRKKIEIVEQEKDTKIGMVTNEIGKEVRAEKTRDLKEEFRRAGRKSKDEHSSDD